MYDVFKAIESRSSTRAYTDQPLSREELEQLVKAGLQAPTATNRQEIHISVVNGSDPILAELEAEKNGGQSAAKNFWYDAPAVFFLSGEDAFHWSAVDAGIAVENMALAAEAMGLGSVIVGCVRDALAGPRREYFAKALGFPQGYSYLIALAVGHKAASKQPHDYDWDKNVSFI